ncbi:MAG: hypothetical protein J6P72_00570 [Firmicutes bacterium]|nr:hypothetical protein [Bacillota bacterium]
MALFKDLFSDYIAKLHCTSKELTEFCQLSPVVISRYRSGERTPLKNSLQLEKLIHGLAALCKDRGIDETEEQIAATFAQALPKNESDIDSTLFRTHLKQLSIASGIPMSHMARALSYDPSYLSKISAGLRFPSFPDIFIEKLCKYVSEQIVEDQEKEALFIRLGIEISEENKSDLAGALKSWFSC